MTKIILGKPYVIVFSLKMCESVAKNYCQVVLSCWQHHYPGTFVYWSWEMKYIYTLTYPAPNKHSLFQLMIIANIYSWQSICYHHMTESSNKIFSFWFQRIHKNKTLTHINVYWAFGGVQKRSAVEISCYSGPVYAALSCYGTANIVSDTHCKHPITHIESNGTSQYQNIALPG